MKTLKIRKIVAIVSSIVEESIIVVIVLWGLPKLGLPVPFWAQIIILIVLMAAWASYSIFTFRLGTRALKRNDVVGLPNMLKLKGEVINPLTPEGLVRIHGELWIASSEEGELEKNTRIIVVSQDRLKLIVKRDITEIAGETYNHPVG